MDRSITYKRDTSSGKGLFASIWARQVTENPGSRELGANAKRSPVRIADYSAMWKVRHWKYVNASAFLSNNRPSQEAILLCDSFRSGCRRVRCLPYVLPSVELRRGTRSISEIALAVGFQSPSAFSTSFTRAVGCSPKQFAAKAA
jgi:AraC-like DNA-binding protein